MRAPLFSTGRLRGGGFARGLIFAAASALWLICGAAADAQAPDAALQARLDAGEFAPAMEMARQAATPRQHDAWLGRIAAAQARGGNRDAALRTAGEIYDDRARADVLSQIRAEPLGGQAGGSEADFDSLIQLMTSTVDPTSWEEVGGPGSVKPFPTGVLVDARGVLGPLARSGGGADLAALRAASALRARYDDARRPSALRKISLTRLEKQVQLRLAAGRPPTETMQVLAGLQRIRYVFVYPETGDLVLAGPAGDWKTDAEDRVVSADGGQPVVRLDDLVVVFRHVVASGDGQFGCLIVPRQEGLQRLRAFIDESSKAPLKPGQRPAWLAQLRSSLGRQDIEVYGLDPRTRAARVMVEADYRMKLVGMGLEPGVPGVESYLASIELGPGQSPPPMGVLRWWFTLDYDALLTGAGGQAFAIRGQGVRVLSENELLTRQGQRVHTGTSDVLNKRFADSFTAHFEALAQKYPVYAELRNLFDLALVAALVDEQDLAGRVGWHLTCFGPGGGYPVASGEAPREVETVINHRVIGGVNVVAGVSGGVRADPVSLVRPSAVETEGDGRLSAGQAAAAPKDLPPGAWWWD